MEITEKFDTDVKVEVSFFWNENTLDVDIKEDLGSDFDLGAWNKQHGGILDNMFDEIEEYIADTVGHYFGARRVSKYHNGQDPVYQLLTTEYRLMLNIKDIADYIENIEEYNGWYMIFLPNNNSMVDKIFGDYVYDKMVALYKDDETVRRIINDIIEVYMDCVEISVYEPSPEFVEFLEQYK